MKRALMILVCVYSALLLSGCAQTISPYNPSSANINSLHRLSKNSQKIALGNFVDPNQTRTISCRLSENENLPGNVTYAEYIKNALHSELVNVGLYSNTAKKRLDAHLDQVDFSSTIGNGKWTIQFTFNDHHQSPYTVRSIYKFSTNFVAHIACTEVAQAFVPAAQKFLHTLYQNKHFRKTLSKASVVHLK